MFWILMLVLILAVVGVSVLVGLNLKSSARHKSTREEVLALKASGAFKHRKSNQ